MGLLPLLALTLGLQGEKPIASVKMATATATVGKPLKGTLSLTLPEGWHGYQNPPAGEFDIPVKLSATDAGVKLGKVEYPKGKEMKMEGQDKPTMVYEGTISVPFTVVATKPASGLSFRVDYQLCNSSSCLPPDSLTVKAPLKVVVAPAKKAPKKP